MLNGHRSLSAGSCLISELLKKLTESNSHADLNIILPTQRLCLFLSRELALLAGGATVLPRLWTWDRFVDDLTAQISFGTQTSNMVMVSFQCELMMEHILEKRAADSSRALHTNPRHAHELVHLAAELARSGPEDNAHQRLLQYLENDWRRSGEVLQHLTQRIDDFFGTPNDYEQILSKLQWTTRERERGEGITGWLKVPRDEQRQTLPMGEILIAGLTSLPPIESKLLGALSKLDGVSVWLDEPPAQSEAAPLSQLRRQVGLPAFTSPLPTLAPGVRQITGCSDITHEVAYVLEAVRRLIAGGTPAHEIAVIVPNEDQYAPALAALATSLGVDVNMPLARSWSTSLLGRWLSLVTNLGAGDDIHGFGQFILSPMTKELFDAPDDFDDSLFQRELKNLPEFGFDGSAICAQYQRKLNAASADFIKRALSWCFHSTDQGISDAQKRLVDALDKIACAIPTGTAADHKALEILKKAADQVAQLDAIRKFTPGRWSIFLSDVYRTAAQESLRETGEPLSGVQIIGLTEARYIPFSKVFIVGCVEGSFPQGLPRDSLIDNQMRRAMGLPGWSELEALEDTTFHLLTSRLPDVELTYSQWDAETPLIRSRWVEMLASKVELKLLDPSDQSASILCQAEPSSRGHGNLLEEGQAEGLVNDSNDLTASTSASRLRNLLWCPYRFLLQSRHIEPLELPDDRIHAETGDWLHKVLEIFFRKDDLKQIPSELQWSRKPIDPVQFGAWAHDRLDAITRSIVPQEFLGSAQFQHMTGRGWQSVALYWETLFAKGWSPDQVLTETTFGKSSKIALTIEGMPINVHGTIDAVHLSDEAMASAPGGAGPLIMDYKTSTTPATTLVAAGLEPQLPLYAKVLSSQGVAANPGSSVHDLEQFAIGYFNLSEGKPSFVALGEKAKTDFLAKGLISKRNKPANLADACRAIEQRWASRLKEIASKGQFLADPSDCSRCSYAGVCRKDDPRHRSRIRSQQVALAAETTGTEEWSAVEPEVGE